MCRVLFLVVVLFVGGRTVLASNTSSTIWDTLMGECSTASFRCVQDSLHRSLEGSLSADFAITDSIVFRKNENKYSQEANTVKHDDTEPEEEFDEWVNSVEDAEADLDGKKAEEPRSSAKSVGGVSDILYNRGVHYLMTHDLDLGLPEPVFGGGRLKISPKSIDEDGGVIVKLNFEEPEKDQGRLYFKNIKKYFKKKLMTSFMAAMLIIKLIKVKLMFLIPLVVGVSTAKKILLKVLLFLFPALAHLFKLCAFYHHHHSKYHLHHHHQVAHHHHHPPPVYSYPSHSEYYAHPPPGAEIIHRSEQAGNELSSWGIEYQPEPESADNRVYNVPPPPKVIPVVPVPIAPVVPAAPAGPPIAAPAPPIVAAAYNEDNFYNPILKRLDRVFAELGFTDEPCKERLVCSMYKAPARFSPHSNLVSAEISRDPSELQKPVFSNPGVIRFFRYVEAARSGQEGKDCLALFPTCPLLTE